MLNVNYISMKLGELVKGKKTSSGVGNICAYICVIGKFISVQFIITKTGKIISIYRGLIYPSHAKGFHVLNTFIIMRIKQ